MSCSVHAKKIAWDSSVHYLPPSSVFTNDQMAFIPPKTDFTLCSLSHILVSPRFCLMALYLWTPPIFLNGFLLPIFYTNSCIPKFRAFFSHLFLLSCHLISLPYHLHLQPSEVEAPNSYYIFVGPKGHETWGAGLEQKWGRDVPKPPQYHPETSRHRTALLLWGCMSSACSLTTPSSASLR